MDDPHDVAPNPVVFSLVSSGDTSGLDQFRKEDLRPFLPLLVGSTLNTCEDLLNVVWSIQKLLLDIKEANRVVTYYSTDFTTLRSDLLKEQQLRRKMSRGSKSSGTTRDTEHGVCREFEKGSIERKYRLLLSELLSLMAEEDKSTKEKAVTELLDASALKWEIVDMVCVAMVMMSSLLPPRGVTQALLQSHEGVFLILQIVANFPSYFDQIARGLIQDGEAQEGVSPSNQSRTLVLRKMCQLDPSRCSFVQTVALEQLKMPSLVLYLSHDLLKEGSSAMQDSVVTLLYNILICGSGAERSWFSQYLKLVQHKYRRSHVSALSIVRQHLYRLLAGYSEGITLNNDQEVEPMDTVDTDVNTEEEMDVAKATNDIEEFPQNTSHLSDEECMNLTVLLKVCSALKSLGLFVSKKEAYMLLYVITSLTPPPTNCGVQLIKTMIAVLIASPFLISNKQREEAVVKWLKYLLDKQDFYNKTDSASYSDLLLLLAIHFQERQRTQILELLSDILCFDVQSSVRPGKHSDVRDTYLSVFTEEVICQQALLVQPTPSLNAEMTGFYPLHCIYNLLKSQMFSKHSVSVTSWVFDQVLLAREPLHPTLPSVVQELVAAILSPPSRSGSTYRQPAASENTLLMVFKQPHPEMPRPSPASQLLTLYYILLYHNTWLSHLKSYSSHSRHPPPPYRPALLSSCPTKHLLRHAQLNHKEYSMLYPSLVKLVATHLPHIAMATDWLGEVPTHTPLVKGSLKSAVVKKGLHPDTPPSQAILVLERLSLYDVTELIPFESAIVTSLPRLLYTDTPRRLQNLVCIIWRKLNMVMDEKLWVSTVNALSSEFEGKTCYSGERLIADPLLVLKCDSKVFRCPPLMEVVLHVLSMFLSASRSRVTEQTHQMVHSSQSSSTNSVTVNERDEFCNNYISLQESAAIQMLIETCLTQESDKADQLFGNLLSNQREIQCLVFSYVHQVFIAYPNIAKLVHFQGYASEVIPAMVGGVPSMHICLDFLSELLSSVQPSKQLFGVQLACQVLAQYPLAKGSDVAQLIVRTLQSLLASVPVPAYGDMFLPVLPNLVALCQGFPPLTQEVTQFLLQLGRRQLLAGHSTVAHSNRTSTLTDSTNIEKSFQELSEITKANKLYSQNRILLAVQQTFKQLAEAVLMIQ